MITREDTSLSVVDPETIARLRSVLPRQSKECVMERLGISSNTWTKMKRGEPVRRAAVERALRRMEAHVAAAG